MIDGLLCVGGRLTNAGGIAEASKHPIILPKKNLLVDLIVKDIHARCGHSGREYVLSVLRRRFWVIDARASIRRVRSKCIDCKKRDTAPSKQQMAALPSDRVTPGGPPFSNCGIDFFGPYFVKRGRARAKRYICLFSDLITRGVHLEVAHSMDADSFIQCLQRFIARRSRPKVIRSDQGRNFIRASKDLATEVANFNEKKIQDYLNKEDIEWKFQPPYSSHHGGCFERMIRIVRRVMSGLCKEQVLTDEGLLTLVCMAEGIVNNRPLTANSADPSDLMALTPNHFLIMQPTEGLPGVFGADDMLRKTWRQIEHLSNVFWRRWVREYLPTLQQRTEWLTEVRNLSRGDLVLVVDSNLPRNQWLLGRVIDVKEGDDGKVRSVDIKTKNSTIKRPITKVCLLEVADEQLPQDKVIRNEFISEE